LIPERLQEALIVVFVVDILLFILLRLLRRNALLYRNESHKEAKSIG
jgi:hypothetical protein